MSSPSSLGTRKREQQQQPGPGEKENEVAPDLTYSRQLGSKRRAGGNRPDGQLPTAAEGHDSQAAESSLLAAAATGASATGPYDVSPRGQADAGSQENGSSEDAPPLERPPPPRRFAPHAFYGSRLQQAAGGTGGSRQQASEERVLRFLRAVHRRLGGPAAPWLAFPTQQAAFDVADAQPGVDVFSVERGERGWRRFVATPRAEFWRRYREMLPAHRHWYEIIREGTPCHLYFGALALGLLAARHCPCLAILLGLFARCCSIGAGLCAWQVGPRTNSCPATVSLHI